MSDLKIKPVVTALGDIEWIFHKNGIFQPLMVISDYEFKQLMADYKMEKLKLSKFINSLADGEQIRRATKIIRGD